MGRAISRRRPRRYIPSGRSSIGRRSSCRGSDAPPPRRTCSAGRAVFSLVGQGEVRTVHVAHVPQRAKWTAVRGRPLQWPGVAKAGKPSAPTEYQQDGEVWQAEEVRIGGRWQRYFGFVGTEEIHRAPADEIEFDSFYGSQRLDESLAVWIIWPGEVGGEDEHQCTPIVVGGAIPIRLRLMNRKGTDQAVPQFFDAADAKPADGRVAVRTRLWFAPESFGHGSTVHREILEAASKLKWTELKRSRSGPLPFAPTAGKVLGPAERRDAAAFDLAQWFPVEKPGTYHLEFDFDRASKQPKPLHVFMIVRPK